MGLVDFFEKCWMLHSTMNFVDGFERFVILGTTEFFLFGQKVT